MPTSIFKYIYITFLSSCLQITYAQTDVILPIKAEIKPLKNTFKLNAYGELYGKYLLGENSQKEEFISNHNVNNDLNFNLFYVKANYSTSTFRSNLTVGEGTYMQMNYSSEEEIFNKIIEANVGFKLSKKHNLWLDAGIMPSHIGFESAVGADCWSGTRSYTAEISPYFESGLKLAYQTKNDKLNIALLAINGWQNVSRYNPLERPLSAGVQVKYNLTPSFFINYSNFIGPANNNIKKLKTYHNTYVQWEKNKIGLQVGFDYGIDNDTELDNLDLRKWNSYILAVRYKVHKKINLNLRYDNFINLKPVIIFNPWIFTKPIEYIHSGTANIDFQLKPNLLLRTEARFYSFSNFGIRRNDDLLSLNAMLCLSL